MASRRYWPRQRVQVFRWLLHLYQDRLTDGGRALFWVGLVSTASLATFVVQSYQVFCVLAALVLVSPPLARLARTRLRLSHRAPRRVEAGTPAEIVLEAENPTPRVARDHAVRLRVTPSLPEGDLLGLPRLGPGESVSRAVQVAFPRRGRYVVDGLRQECSFPFGLWRDLVDTGDPQEILVHPWFHPLEELDLPVGRRYQPGGLALSSSVGDSTEFIGTREYRPGDQVRDIHWRSWGRLGKPVVKEFQEEYFCRIALVLDTFVPPASGDRYRRDFEASLSMAAALADRLSQGEYVIDLFAAGPDLYSMQAGRNLAHLENVLDVLACLEPCREPPFEKLAPVLLENMRVTTSVVVVALDWDEARERLVRVVKDQGPAVKTVLVRTEAPTLDPAGVEDLVGPVSRLTPEEVEQGVDRL